MKDNKSIFDEKEAVEVGEPTSHEIRKAHKGIYFLIAILVILIIVFTIIVIIFGNINH